MMCEELGGPEKDWLNFGEEEGKVTLLLGKGVEGLCVMEDVGECVLYWLGRWWQTTKQLLYG